jgi:formate hydrogenlyase transcriptional activator
MKRLKLPNAPADQAGPVKVWTEAVMIPAYHPLPPDKNPMFLEKRVYQGSSGRVYPLPFADRIATEAESVPSVVMKGLTAWEWPGNIRELENFIERAVILTRGKALEVPLTELRKTDMETATDAVVVNKKQAARKTSRSRPDSAGAEEYERKQRERIIQALTACKGHTGGPDGAAARLGIARTTLIYRMRKLGIYAKLYS